MKLIGLMLVRNEAWVLPASLPAALQWVDHLFVVRHLCTDASYEILLDAQKNAPRGQLQIGIDHREEYEQANLRQELLDHGRRWGGTHFAVLDADEILTKPAQMYVRNEAEKLQPGQILYPPWLHCWRSLANYRADDSPFGTRARCKFLFRDGPGVGYDTGTDYQMHSREPNGVTPVHVWEHSSGMGVLHLQHANWMRVVAKQKRYAEDEMRRWGKVRANYAAATDETGLKLKPIPPEWWPVDPKLVDLEAKAWQAQ